MLEGLDRVDSAWLRHAYGSARDVPGLLRNVASPDQDARDAALEDLWSRLCNQGTV